MYDEPEERTHPIKLVLLLVAALIVGVFVFSQKVPSADDVGEFGEGSSSFDASAERGSGPDGGPLFTGTEFVRTNESSPAGAAAGSAVDGGVAGARISGLRLPDGFTRVAKAGEMTEYCRGLALKPQGTPVRLFDGTLKPDQDSHVAVLDIDVGKRDLQQCADAVMRIRGEYLFAAERFDDITFNFTSGDACVWNKWKEGWRPNIVGNNVTWEEKRPADHGYQNFRNYMNMVFIYAGSASLAQEMAPVPFASMQIGDVLIKGGYPGHAVMVLDMAKNPRGRTVYLLAQSYTPAQSIHVLKNPADPRLSPWYELDGGTEIVTPDWTFQASELKRFN